MTLKHLKAIACSLTSSAVGALVQPEPDKKRRRLFLTVHLLSFVVLCLIVFARQIPVVMFRYDGTFLLISAKNQAQWMGDGAAFTMNFLEGNGGLWWAQINTLFDPALVFAQWIASDTYVPVVAYTIYAIEFFLATVLLGSVLGLRLSVSLTAAWLGSLVSFPFFVPTLGTDLLWGNPHGIPVISLMAVMVYALTRIKAARYSTAFIAAFALLAIGIYIGFEFAGGALQVIPTAFALSIACIWNSETAAERNIKIVVLILIGAVLSILFGRFLIGLYLDTKGTVFPLDMWPRPLSFENISNLLAPGGRGMNRLLWLLALCGAILFVAFGKRPLRTFAIAYLTIEAGIVATIALIKIFIGDWWGPNPAYFDIYVYTLASLFGAATIFVLIDVAWPFILPRLKQIPSFVPTYIHAPAHRDRNLLAFAFIPWLCLAWAHHPYSNRDNLNRNPWRWPPQSTAMTDFLQQNVGLTHGATFRGRVANLAGSTFDKPLAFVPFATQHNYDQIPLVYVGNEHRLYGLLYFGIPILIESNHFSSPFFHLVTTRLMNDGPITSSHAQTALTKFDPRVLAAFGVRYVVTDFTPQEPAKLVMTFKIVEGRAQYLYEIENPNTGNYSPTEVITAGNATEAIKRMAAPRFDFSKQVVLTEPLAATDWTPADRSEIKVQRDRLEISATSSGQSIVVLPVEFSHCLEFDLKSDRPIEVRRANLEQTAVVFTRSVTGSIALRYGPFANPDCRLADLRDAESLKLGAVPRDGLLGGR